MRAATMMISTRPVWLVSLALGVCVFANATFLSAGQFVFRQKPIAKVTQRIQYHLTYVSVAKVTWEGSRNGGTLTLVSAMRDNYQGWRNGNGITQSAPSGGWQVGETIECGENLVHAYPGAPNSPCGRKRSISMLPCSYNPPNSVQAKGEFFHDRPWPSSNQEGNRTGDGSPVECYDDSPQPEPCSAVAIGLGESYFVLELPSGGQEGYRQRRDLEENLAANGLWRGRFSDFEYVEAAGRSFINGNEYTVEEGRLTPSRAAARRLHERQQLEAFAGRQRTEADRPEAKALGIPGKGRFLVVQAPRHLDNSRWVSTPYISVEPPEEDFVAARPRVETTPTATVDASGVRVAAASTYTALVKLDFLMGGKLRDLEVLDSTRKLSNKEMRSLGRSIRINYLTEEDHRAIGYLVVRVEPDSLPVVIEEFAYIPQCCCDTVFCV